MAKRQNLFLQSQNFGNASWAKNLCTAASGAIAAPDGMMTADGLIPTDTSFGNRYVRQSSVGFASLGCVSTLSVWAKRGSVNWLVVSYAGSYVSFDLLNGVLGLVNLGSARITAYPDGWYRCDITSSLAMASFIVFNPSTNNNTLSHTPPNAVDPEIYLWGAGFTLTSSFVSYTPTTTAAINTGNLRNIAQKGPQNLLTYSEQFNNAAWSKANATVVPDAGIAPNGTLTADLVYPTTTGTFRYVYQQLSTSTVRTGDNLCFSVYAKAAGKTWLSFIDFRFNNCVVWFDLANGVIGTSSQLAQNARMEAVGGGWYRCSMAYTPVLAPANCYILAVDANGSQTSTVNGTDGILVWGAQGVIANHPGPYVSTTGAVVNTGNIRSVARKRQNLFTYSQTFQNVTWTKQGCTALDNQAIAPDGTLTAALITDSATLVKWVRNGASTDVGATRTMSFYGKAGTMRWVAVYPNNATTGSVSFDLATGSIGVVNTNVALLGYGVEPVGNGWYRCFVTFIRTISSSNDRIYLANADNSASYVGGTGTWYFWGGQQVLGNNPGPYTPTTSVAINTGNLRQLAQKKQNLLLQSQTFDSASWSKQAGVSVTPNQAIAPDGTMTADLLDWSAAANGLGIIQTVTAVGERRLFIRSFWVRAVSGTAAFAVIEGSGGTLISGGGIQTVGTTWQKFSSTFLSTFASQSPWLTRQSSSGNVYIWGAQLVRANHTGPYVETTTVAYNRGDIRNIAQKKQNLYTYSNTFSNAIWVKSAGSAAISVTEANPRTGALDVTEFSENAAAATTHSLFRDMTDAVTGEWITFSAYLKNILPAMPVVGLLGNSGILKSAFNLITGTQTAVTAGITTEMISLGNGWYRCSVTYQHNATQQRIYIMSASDSTVAGETHNGVNAPVFYVYGAQRVKALGPGPYVETTAVVINTGNIRSAV